jgi:hypothetical protein
LSLSGNQREQVKREHAKVSGTVVACPQPGEQLRPAIHYPFIGYWSGQGSASSKDASQKRAKAGHGQSSRERPSTDLNE